MSDPVAIILGGGKGSRLYPLTATRAKPAVPFIGRYRLVDIPISNCINSGYRRIYVLTQFNSASLHLHIARTYIFDSFSRGFVEILAAQQSLEPLSGWYQGTVDAVRKNLNHFRTQQPSHYLILSGDQLYRMNLRRFFEQHQRQDADVTLAVTPIGRSQITELGIVRIDRQGQATAFLEKPPAERDISQFYIPPELMRRAEPNEPLLLASMGIYCFNAKTLEAVLENDMADFGRELFPFLLNTKRCMTYIYRGFWTDIGTIPNFYETNIKLASHRPEFDFYDERNPIYTQCRELPSSRFGDCQIAGSLAASGARVDSATIRNSVIGIRSRIERDVMLDGVICMGADFYESADDRRHNRRQGIPNIGIGSGTQVRRAIIDKNAHIGSECRIGVDSLPRPNHDEAAYSIRNGIVIIPKNATLPSGSVI